MNKLKGKVKYIVISLFVILIIFIIVLLIFNNKNKEKDIFVDFSEVIGEVDYDSKKVIMSNNKIFSKYDVSSDSINELLTNVKFGQYDGKLFYVRSNKMNANVFQMKNRISITSENHAPLLAQVATYMSIFKNQALEYLKLNMDSEPLEEKISGDTKSNLPLVEQIYIEKRTYSLTYKANDVLHDINFYMDNDYFVCEIVKFLK